MAAKAKRRTARKVTVNRKRRRRVVARNPHRATHRRRTRRTNPKVVVRYRTRRHNRRRHAVKRNPSVFGARLGSKQSLTMIGGGLTGVVATKFLPTLIPTSMAPQLMTSNIGRTAVSLGAALASGWLATKFVGAPFGEGVYFGGLMQTASVALNTFLPAVYKTLGIGLGDFVPGQFAVPQNPVRGAISGGSHMPAPAGSLTRTSSLGRAYQPAY